MTLNVDIRFHRLARALLLVATSCGARDALPPSGGSDLLGKTVELTLVSNDGQPTTIPRLKSKTVIDYWAPSCVPCRTKVPALVAIRRDLEAAGSALVLVAVLADTESTDLAQKTLSAWGLPKERFLIDREDLASRQADVHELPTTQVFDSSGNLRWVGGATSKESDVLVAVRALP